MFLDLVPARLWAASAYLFSMTWNQHALIHPHSFGKRSFSSGTLNIYNSDQESQFTSKNLKTENVTGMEVVGNNFAIEAIFEVYL